MSAPVVAPAQARSWAGARPLLRATEPARLSRCSRTYGRTPLHLARQPELRFTRVGYGDPRSGLIFAITPG